MGGLGRDFDGGYASFTLVPTAEVKPSKRTHSPRSSARLNSAPSWGVGHGVEKSASSAEAADRRDAVGERWKHQD